MKVSVVLVTYNHEKYIAQAVASVLMQKTDFEFELLISEDYSTDRTRDILFDLQREHPDRIELILSPRNINTNEVTTRAIKVARGDYIAVLDGDDYWTSPHKLQRQVAFFEEHADCALCFHNVSKIREDGVRAPEPLNRPDQKQFTDLYDIARANYIGGCSIMFRKEALADLDAWCDKPLFGDWRLYVHAAKHGRIGYLPDVMGVYRIHAGGIWSGLSGVQQIDQRIRFFKELTYRVPGDLAGDLERLIAELGDEVEDLIIGYDARGNRREMIRGHLLLARRFFGALLRRLLAHVTSMHRPRLHQRYAPLLRWANTVRRALSFSQRGAPLYAGYHEQADRLAISGWAWDTARPDARLELEIRDRGELIGTVRADRYRPDLEAAGIGDGYHAFWYPEPSPLQDGGSHRISVTVKGDGWPLPGTPIDVGSNIASPVVPAHVVASGPAVQTAVQPLVSVVIPCYNLGTYLREAVDSVLRQTYDNFEIIVVDDGSTDPGTQALLESFAAPRTRVIRTANQGLARARNLGLSLARGHYVSFLDADDAFEPNLLERTVSTLEAEPELYFASFWLRAFGEQDFLWHPDSCAFPRLLAEDTFCTAALLRKSVVDEIGGFDALMPMSGYEDWDLAITLVEQGLQGVVLPEYLFRYRIRAGSMRLDCNAPNNHAALMRYITSKHRDSYMRHFPEVLDAIESRIREHEADHARPDTASAATTRAFIAPAAARAAGGAMRAEVVITNDSDNAIDATLASLRPLFEAGIRAVIAGPAALDRQTIVDRDSDHIRAVITESADQGGCRTVGLRSVQAPIVFALSAGDSVDANGLLTALEVLERDDDIDFVIAGLYDVVTGFTWRALDVSLAGVLTAPRLPFPVVRRAALARIGAYDSNFKLARQADWDLVIRLTAAGMKGHTSADPILRTFRPSGAPAGSCHPRFVSEVIHEHRALAEEHWQDILLGHEMQRVQLLMHVQSVPAPST